MHAYCGDYHAWSVFRDRDCQQVGGWELGLSQAGSIANVLFIPRIKFSKLSRQLMS